MKKMFWAAGLMFLATTTAQAIERGKPVHGLAMYGVPKHGPDFTHFDFVNPDAPKGGTLVRSNENDQTFDTFNGFTLKGSPARGIGLTYDTLMVDGADETFSAYCLVCETVEVAVDNTWIEYNIRPQARFHDGSPITAEDVAFSFEILTTKGAPNIRTYWAGVDRAEVKDTRTVRFHFKSNDNRELPMIMGQLPVLSKEYWQGRDFEATTLDAPLGSGPYKLDSFEIGRFIAYARVADYWAKDLAVVRGMNNFDVIRYEFFRDDAVSFEAFKGGEYDVHREATARQWATAYDFPAVKNGKVVKLEISDGQPMTTQSLILNLRRPIFRDRRVREALNLAFDFESLNRTIFFNAYARLRSYWQKSDLEAKGLPSVAELALLEPWRGKVPDNVFSAEFTQPTSDGRGNIRANLTKAAELLKAAGWVLQSGKLVNAGTRQPFEFEILLVQASLDRIYLPFAQNLERLGIKATLRVIDSTQYFNRINEFDYDTASVVLPNTLNPGNEQAYFWGSAAADQKGSPNYSGVKDPAVDALIDAVISAPDRETLVAATRALDRVLTWNHYRLLTYSSGAERYAHWTKLKRPDRFPLQGIGSAGGLIETTWWADPNATSAAGGERR
ncbi:MAG: extracellular solute-binding protein [Rhodospirillaceae bacterium]|nr:extracellular solute-binding protein [Rhodospirillaceae bacterium]